MFYYYLFYLDLYFSVCAQVSIPGWTKLAQGSASQPEQQTVLHLNWYPNKRNNMVYEEYTATS